MLDPPLTPQSARLLWPLLLQLRPGTSSGRSGRGARQAPWGVAPGLPEQPELKLLLQEPRMIQNVIYRRKAESLAPGRDLLLNYILWGVEVCVGLQPGKDFHLLPATSSLCCPSSKQGPSLSCCQRGNSPFSVRGQTAQGRWERGRRPEAPLGLPLAVLHGAGLENRMLGRITGSPPCFWAGE